MGFTVVEMVIIISILVLISAVLLANFPAFSRRADLQRTSQQLALAARKAQNMAFAARQAVRVGGGASIPSYFGVYIGAVVGCPGEPRDYNYIIFADFHPPGSPNRQYDCGRDPVVERFKFERGVSLSDVIFTPSGESAESLDPDVIHITFSVPEARTGLLDRNNREGTVAEIILAGEGALTRKITIRNTGQIYSR